VIQDAVSILNYAILNQEANAYNRLIVDCCIKLSYNSQTLQQTIQLQHSLVRPAVSVQKYPQLQRAVVSVAGGPASR